jgi:hypothetical protein
MSVRDWVVVAFLVQPKSFVIQLKMIADFRGVVVHPFYLLDLWLKALTKEEVCGS